jgi:hypothetical protein
MKSNVGSTMIAAGVLAAVAMLATPSHAQNQPVQVTPMPYPTTPYRAPVGAEKTELVTPNPVLLGGGGVLFLGGYVPSLVVAASSDHDGDKWLYAPVIGPWIDWATRKCGSGDNPATCGVNGFDRAAFIASGTVQALGVLGMLGSFVSPQRRVVTTTAQVHIAPVSFNAHSHGLAAFGTF